MMSYVVELEKGVWTAEWEGDPGRTCKLEDAERYKTKEKAVKALTRARAFRMFICAKIYKVQDE